MSLCQSCNAVRIALFGAAALLAAIAPPSIAGSGNYLIVTAEAYAGSAPLDQFVAAKTAMGFDVSVYIVPAGTSRTAIRAYIQGLWRTPDAPEYLLIVGDTDGDPSTATTIPHWTGGGSRNAPTDLPYACMGPGDDWYPEIHVGRFSVRSVAMLQAVVDKTLFVEAGDYPDPEYVKRAAFLATGDGTALADQNHDWVIANYFDPAEFQAIRIYQSQGGGTQDITNAVNLGCLFTVYFGHSGPSGWSGPGFNQSNVNALVNDGLYGLVMGWSCNTAQYTSSECFGETWQRKANGGAAAYLSASSYVWWGSVEAWESSRRMERYFFEAIFVDDIWEVRPAWDAALWKLLADPDFGPAHDHTRNIFEEFVLLGDPALLLPKGIAFTLRANPASQDVCAPPVDEATYVITVEQHMGFDEAITLGVSGLPAGTQAWFSENGLPPPYVSVLTITGLSGADQGGYAVQVTGTSATMERSIVVGLNLTDGAPGQVALLLPENGAVDVSRRPGLEWTAVEQGLYYELEIATDPDFLDVVYAATAVDTQHTVGVYLDAMATHYWRVRATNPCGTGPFSAVHTFITAPQIDYFTEQFETGFDLDGTTLAFLPDGSDDYYAMCALQINALPTDPTGGTMLTLGDDQSVQVMPSQTVWIYGTGYLAFYVNSNGNITFTGDDSTYTETFAAHFAQRRVAALFDDLNPGAGGTVSWKEYANRVVVTWENVPEYSNTGANTFQIELFFNGEIHISWLGITAQDAIAGLSGGGGIPGDFEPMDLSAGHACTWADFALSVLPASAEVCAPAQATYSVEVSQYLGFDDAVTLSVTGLPPGTSASFDVNAQVPPFTSVMAVSGTHLAAPGSYALEVLGTAVGTQHSVVVGLELFDDVPGEVGLVSPANGQIDLPWSPTFTWSAAVQAQTYVIEIAGDANFLDVIYSAELAQTEHTLPTTLESGTQYYWRVHAINACGDGADSAVFRFTTIEQPDYFTEQFTGGADPFDLAFYTLRFIPDGAGNFYDRCGNPAAALPTDPAGGTVLTLGDDTSAAVSPGLPVSLYGISYSTFWVNSNGNVTFSSGDNTYNESLTAHFNQPRVCAVFDDLNPATGGQVSWKNLPDRVAVTWLNVPQYGTQDANTFQIELFHDGEIGITWLAIATSDAIAGLSAGHGLPGDYIETDLSGPSWRRGDLNCDCHVDFDDIDAFVLALESPSAYQAAYPDCRWMNADTDGDGDVDFDDIDPFIAMLGG